MGWPSRGSVSPCRAGQEMSWPCGQRRTLVSRRGRQGSTVLPRSRPRARQQHGHADGVAPSAPIAARVCHSGQDRNVAQCPGRSLCQPSGPDGEGQAKARPDRRAAYLSEPARLPQAQTGGVAVTGGRDADS